MPLYINDETTTQQEAVQAEFERDPAPVSLVEKVQKLWAEHPLPPATGKIADKAFFDELSGEYERE